MANFGLAEHQEIIEKLCRICGERLKKAKDRYENSFLCADKRELIFSAFGIKVHDDPETCPSKFCHKCYKLASRGGTCLTINVWPPHKRTGNCAICSSFKYKEQQKPGRRKKSKPGVKSKDQPHGSKEMVQMIEGMSGTLSFQPDQTTLLFSKEIKNLKSYHGTEPLYPEQFAENIKHEYICPICKEVLDQPVQTKCQTPHIFCAGCLSFSFEMCGAQCPICRTVIENPSEFIQPAPFVLQTILSEIDFKCPTCSQTVKLHQLPQHQEGCIPNPTDTIAPTRNVQQQSIPLQGTVQGLAPLLRLHTPPIPAITPTPPQPQTQTTATAPAPVQLPVPGPAKTYAEQVTIQQLLHSSKEAYSSIFLLTYRNSWQMNKWTLLPSKSQTEKSQNSLMLL